MTLIIASLSLWYAWRYSRTTIDPDWAMFNLGAFTGALYGKHFLDCKTPLIHIWYWAIAKVVGNDVLRVRFVHHLLVSLPGLIVGGWHGLAYVALINSGWLLGFHGNVGQQAAGFILLALHFYGIPFISATLLMLAIAFEPKLLPAAIVVSLLFPSWWPALMVCLATSAGVAAIVFFFWPDMWKWLVESNLTVTKRITQMRYHLAKDGHDYTIWASMGAMYTLPWLALAIMNNPDPLYWLAPASYLIVIASGLAVRSNHYIPLAPWIALALPEAAILALVVTDLVSGFGYWKNIWKRFYSGLDQMNNEAQEIGQWLRDKVGALWVNDIHTGINIYSGKPPLFGLAEQIEIRENAVERRQVMRAAFKDNPPDWVVVGPQPGLKFSGNGYKAVKQTSLYMVYRKV